MIKLAGCALIAISAAAVYRELCREERRRLAWAVDCRQALEQMAAAIRALRQPLPEVVEQQSRRICCGAAFSRILQGLKLSRPLAAAWREAFADLAPPELSEILCAVEPGGDETMLLGRLDRASVQLAEYETRERGDWAARRRLRLAVVLSAAGFLMILLM